MALSKLIAGCESDKSLKACLINRWANIYDASRVFSVESPEDKLLFDLSVARVSFAGRLSKHRKIKCCHTILLCVLCTLHEYKFM